jgi:hypothetical protein
MESSSKYHVEPKPIYPAVSKEEKIMQSAYFLHARSLIEAALIGGYGAEDAEELVDGAIALMDKLIEKVGEKM